MKRALVSGVVAFTATMALGQIYLARAEPPSQELTVDGRDYPVCQYEDCSDQTGQIGVWFDPDTGRPWLSMGNHSVPIDTTADCTTTDAYAREVGDDNCDGTFTPNESGYAALIEGCGWDLAPNDNAGCAD